MARGLFCPEPREQGVDLVDGMIRDARENVGKIGLRIDTVHPAGLDVRVPADREHSFQSIVNIGSS
jgi:hypothetical protein